MLKRLDKLPKRKVTVDELLDLDDLNQLVSRLIEMKTELLNVIVCYEKTDGSVGYLSSRVNKGTAIYILEQAKLDIMGVYDAPDE